MIFGPILRICLLTSTISSVHRYKIWVWGLSWTFIVLVNIICNLLKQTLVSVSVFSPGAKLRYKIKNYILWKT